MSLHSAPSPEPLPSVEQQIADLDHQIEEAQLTFQGDLVRELETKRTTLLSQLASESEKSSHQEHDPRDDEPDVASMPDILVSEMQQPPRESEIGSVLEDLLQQDDQLHRKLYEISTELRKFDPNSTKEAENRKQELLDAQRKISEESANLMQVLRTEYQKALETFDQIRDQVEELGNTIYASQSKSVEGDSQYDQIVAEYRQLSTRKDKLSRIIIETRGRELAEMELKVGRKIPLTGQELQSLYFGRNFLSSSAGIRRILNDRHEVESRDTGFDLQKDEERLEDVGFKDLQVLFDCGYGQIVTSPLDVVIRKSDIRVFVGKPDHELIGLLERMPELRNIHFFREFPGKSFPVKEMTFEEMKAEVKRQK